MPKHTNVKGHRLPLFINSRATFGDVDGTVTRAWFGNLKADGSHEICLEIGGKTYKDVSNVRFRHCSATPMFTEPVTVDGQIRKSKTAA
jgi:hypothetical protein